MDYHGKVIENETLELDGNRFFNCDIRNCTLVYKGGAMPLLQGNSISDSQWSFGDGAGRTLELLKGLASDHEDFGRMIRQSLQL